MTESSSLVPGGPVAFDAYRLEVDRHRLWRGEQEIPLRPKSWDALCYLVARPGLLVTKEALHREIWPDTAVSDNTLTQVITELRQALGDNPRTPRIIETVHGLGFRFVAEVRSLGNETGRPTSAAAGSASTAASLRGETASAFVGRRAELVRLHECLNLAGQGARQLVFITGEAGIGKTTLSESFLRAAASWDPSISILQGQCIQQHGPREPYMPVLEALERILRSSRGTMLIPLLRRVAPCWYAQIPWLLAEGELPEFQGAMMNAAPQRMLRELCAFLESMAAQSTVVLLLEDLHWSDHATTDLLSFLAERRDPARLLIIATYRPTEVSMQDHPIREVRQTLRSHGRCVDLALPYLSAADLREYLHHRFGELAQDLAPLIHARTDGNPLFAVAIVEEMIRRRQLTNTDRGWVVADRLDLGVPDDLTEMVALQFHGLGSDERTVLEAASVAGVTFAPWTVARAVGRDVEAVEAIAQQLVRSQLFLTVPGHAEDHASVRLYEFFHALHHKVIYEQVTDGARRRLHQAIGEVLESACGDRLLEIAPELSVHFERSHDHARAIKYLALCIRSAQQRFAHREAVVYARKALDLLQGLPETPHRQQTELEIRMLQGVSLNVTQGYLSRQVGENYERARTLCMEVGGDARQLFEIVHAIWYSQLAETDEAGARRSADELVRIAKRLNRVDFELRSDLARGRTELWNGHFGVAVRVLTEVRERIEKDAVEFHADAYGIHPEFAALGQGSLALWFHGCPDQARTQVERALAHAERRGEPLDVASGLCQLALVQHLCRNTDAVLEAATRALAVCREKDVVFFLHMSQFFAAAALAERGDLEGGLSEMERSLLGHRTAMGPFLGDVMLTAIAGAHGRSGKWDDGLRCVEEGIAMSETNLERVFAAELWRVKGELLLGKARMSRQVTSTVPQRTIDAAERCFRRALEIARQQESASLGLRAAMNLTRLFQGRDGSREARGLLRSIYASFTEGFDTKDLEEARALLNRPRG